MPQTEPPEFVSRLIQSYGGSSVFFQIMDERQASFMALWQHDATEIGKVLHAQLVVEHFLSRYLAFTNPNLPALDNARLTFAQKTSLLPDNIPYISELKRGLKVLGRIRNRLAHNLKVEVTDEDAQAILGLELFKAILVEGDKRFGAPNRSPLDLIERFAQFAASMFQSASEADSHLWAEAYTSLGSDGDIE